MAPPTRRQSSKEGGSGEKKKQQNGKINTKEKDEWMCILPGMFSCHSRTHYEDQWRSLRTVFSIFKLSLLDLTTDHLFWKVNNVKIFFNVRYFLLICTF